MKQWKWYVYVVECKDGLYYTGLTWNVGERMEQHKSGKGSRFTAKHGFKRLCYTEEYTDLLEAKEREHQIKDFSRKKKEALWNTEGKSSRPSASNNKQFYSSNGASAK